MGILQTTAVVVPCFNEADRLQGQAFVAHLRDRPKLHFVFVDDGSKDGTFSVLESLRGENPGQVHLVRLAKNLGKAEAVRAGVTRALCLDPIFFGYWDADLATSLDYIDAFAAEMQTHPRKTLVFGSRVRLLGHRIDRRSTRHYVGRSFATLASLILGVPVYDTQCGAKLLRNTEVTRAAFAAPFHGRWCFDVELFARLLADPVLRDPLRFSAHFTEYPLETWIHQDGSKVRLAHAPRIFVELLQVARRSRAGRQH